MLLVLEAAASPDHPEAGGEDADGEGPDEDGVEGSNDAGFTCSGVVGLEGLLRGRGLEREAGGGGEGRGWDEGEKESEKGRGAVGDPDK